MYSYAELYVYFKSLDTELRTEVPVLPGALVISNIGSYATSEHRDTTLIQISCNHEHVVVLKRTACSTGSKLVKNILANNVSLHLYTHWLLT